MNKSTKTILCLVMVVAILVMFLLLLHYNSLSSRLSEKAQLLETSQQAWKKTDADKQELQAVLKAKKEELREAEFSLSEAKDRAESIKGEIDELKKDIEALKSRFPASD